MLNTFMRWLLVVALVLTGAFGSMGVASADIDDSRAENAQEGDNEGDSDQGGASESGDAVAGQVTGIVSEGDTSVDATNRSTDVDVESGEVSATNDAASFSGLNRAAAAIVNASDAASTADIDNVTGGSNLQEGDNDLVIRQFANASSGDAVGGQVIGAVTSGGGSTDVVAANTSEDVDVETGEAHAANALAGFAGLNQASLTFLRAPTGRAATADIDASAARNLQEGDNDFDGDQSADSASGDGVGGQVIGAVSAGDTVIDATNLSNDVDVETGEANAENILATWVGLSDSGATLIGIGGRSPDARVADITASAALNLQEGDNDADLGQQADASTGDGVGGQVIGAVTSGGGSADIVAANTSTDADVETGEATATNALAAFSGLNISSAAVLGGGSVRRAPAVADIVNAIASNLQEGDNELSGDQLAVAASGDGVGGQVLGVVSAGDTSIDATNLSEDVDAETGDTVADNALATFVGLNLSNTLVLGGGGAGSGAAGPPTAVADIFDSFAFNLQEGDNARDFGQSADTSSGDAVAGQVAGVVTSAGGSADAVLDNSSEDIDVESGDAAFDNDDASFVGLRFEPELGPSVPGLPTPNLLPPTTGGGCPAGTFLVDNLEDGNACVRDEHIHDPPPGQSGDCSPGLVTVRVIDQRHPDVGQIRCVPPGQA